MPTLEVGPPIFAQPVKLLPARDTFSELLDTCHAAPSKFVPLIGELWRMMNTGGFSFTGQETIRCFSGANLAQSPHRPKDGQLEERTGNAPRG